MLVFVDDYASYMKKFLMVGAILLSLVSLTQAEQEVSAALQQSSWPSCRTEAQVECVESLSYTTASGTFSATDPGGELPPLAPMVQRTHPYVTVIPANPSDPSSTLNFVLVNPLSREIAPNVRNGLEDGTYSFVIRLGAFDPTQTGLSADPVSVTTAQRQDGTFTLSVVAKPKPRVMVMSAASDAACKSNDWTCDGESGIVRNISGFVFQNLIPANRPLFRGMWIATNASAFSAPIVSVLERKVSAKVAGPHTVPPGFPTTDLKIENGKGVNPAFYKFYLPYSVLEAMLSMAPAEIRNRITPEMVKAVITEAGTQKNQPVTLVSDEKGMTVDLGITHYSAPNPEVTFNSPAATATPSQSLTPLRTTKTFAKGKHYAMSSLVSVPAGHRVSKIVISASSRSVCAVSGTRVQMKKKGVCSFSVTTTKKAAKKVIKGKVKVG